MSLQSVQGGSYNRKKETEFGISRSAYVSQSVHKRPTTCYSMLLKAADSSVAVLSRSATFCINIWFWTKANSDKWRVRENKGNTCRAPRESWCWRVFTCARHCHMLMLRVCVCVCDAMVCTACATILMDTSHPAACPRGKQKLWSFAAKAKFMQSRIQLRFELISLVSNTFRMHYTSRLSKTHFNAPGCEICAAVN